MGFANTESKISNIIHDLVMASFSVLKLTAFYLENTNKKKLIGGKLGNICKGL